MLVGLAAKRNSSVETQAAFLDAAGALMTERGTIDVSLCDIAERVGLNVALVSYHFGGKDGLLVALCRRNAEEALASVARLMATDLPPVEKLRRHLAGVIGTFHRYPYLYSLLASLLHDPESETAQQVTVFFAKPLVEAEGIMLRAAEAAGAPVIDPMLFHFAAIGACSNIFMQRAMLRILYGVEAIDADLNQRFTESTVALLMDGYLNRRMTHTPASKGRKTA